MGATFAAVALILAACGGSEERSAAEQAQRIEKQIWSPYCPDRLLADCTTRQAMELRGEIASRLDAGANEDEVLAWVQDNYGEEVYAGPATWLWVFSGAIFAVGVLLVGGLVWRWSRPERDL